MLLIKLFRIGPVTGPRLAVLDRGRSHYVLEKSYRYASEGQNSSFLKDCLFAEIVILEMKL